MPTAAARLKLADAEMGALLPQVEHVAGACWHEDEAGMVAILLAQLSSSPSSHMQRSSTTIHACGSTGHGTLMVHSRRLTNSLWTHHKTRLGTMLAAACTWQCMAVCWQLRKCAGQHTGSCASAHAVVKGIAW
jgi:hypothetical protein